MARWSYAAALLVVVGCGGGSGHPGVDADPNAPDADPNAPDADPNAPDAAVGFVPLITAHWTLPANTETYLCATKTMTQDVYAGTLRPLAPVGTHHTVIQLLATPEGPDNPSFPCGPEFGQFWASGLGTPALQLPDGVGLLAPAGSQLRLSLHLFNTTDNEISGTSGLEIIPLDASQVVHAARVDYHGPFAFSIPATGNDYTVNDQATLPAEHLVAIFPHMHQLGTHFKATLQHGTDPALTLWDEDYQFNSQEFSPMAEIPVQTGDTLHTSCTWNNTTGSPVGWGQSSTAEMCFTILMSY